MAKKIGEILLARKLITAAQLEEALRAQLVNNVRLGTSLIQMDAVKLDDVGRALSNQHGVPMVEQELLQRVSDSVLDLVPTEMAQKHVVVPLHLDGQGLHVAMSDPLRRIAGELSFTLKRSICRYVTPELRMMYLLEKHYGLERDPRFLREKEDPRQQDERRTYIDPTVDAGAEDEQDALDDSTGLVFLDHYENLGGQRPGAEGSVVKALRQIDLVTAKLGEAHTGESIAKLLVEPVLDHTHSAVLFWVRGENAVGCWASGLPDMTQLPRLVVPLKISSLLQLAFTKGRLVRGNAARDPLHMKILQFLQLPEPGEVCVAPVILNNKVVNLLCQHSRPGRPFPPDALNDLQKLSAQATLAYQHLVQQIKS